ncbi:DNA topoisomerase 3-alpha-like [Papaver somniferum]|uniref:DNA topoisomerase 3-alpha-like n=1 Tax=Papaver somniferum TaxID=3469 RepID=UPI000E6F8B37|nr:DNA topoisomerase 3-alpha-like [Papaver somniferum]
MDCNRTMEAVQFLHQSGFITYPRTSSDTIAPCMRTYLHEIVQQQRNHRKWGADVLTHLSLETGLNMNNGGHTDPAHSPIYPTMKVPTAREEAYWTADQRLVYELIVRHFLASVSKPAEVQQAYTRIRLGNDIFNGTTMKVITPNFLVFLRIYEKDHPGFFMQQPVKLDLRIVASKPPPLSEGDLLDVMEKENIGTNATRHELLGKLLTLGYVLRDRNMNFTPTYLGKALITGYIEMGAEVEPLWKPQYRQNLENDLKLIEEGTENKDEVLQRHKGILTTCFQVTFGCF